MNWNSPVAVEVRTVEIGIEVGLDLGGGEQIFEARAGRLRGLANGAGDGGAGGTRADGRGSVDRHGCL